MLLNIIGKWDIKTIEDGFSLIYTNLKTNTQFNCGNTKSMFDDVVAFIANDDGSNPGDLIMVDGKFFSQRNE